MIFSEFANEKLSMLGFGAMRLPTDASGAINEAQVEQMTRYAIEHGVNYFDTAYPYHNGMSERVIGRVLSHYPRESYYLATKFPGHQISESYDPAAVFEEQLEKCGVSYFDFYLLHNVYENSFVTYMDPKWGIVDYFVEQKRLGRIRHLGFSSHGGLDVMRAFLDARGSDMEFCQIQLNYLDWTLQNAKAKVELLRERGLPVWVMEPVRGGRLAKLDDAQTAALKALRPQDSIPSWAFRFLQDVPGVSVILSGMSNMEQMQDNVRTFETRSPLSISERQTLLDIAESMKNAVPCTACRYCCEGCPMGLDIPMLLSMLNELRFAPAVNVSMRLEALSADKRPDACVACGKCRQICPQGIDIPQALKELSETVSKLPSWADICRQRDEILRKKG